MIPSYLDGDADIGIEDIDKINTALFNLEETISTYKPKETKQDYSMVSIHRELFPGEVLQFDPPIYETPVIATINGKSVYIGTLNRKGLLNVNEFHGIDSISSVSEINSETTREYTTSNKDSYEHNLNNYVETFLENIKTITFNVSSSTYQVYAKYSCPGIKCKKSGRTYSITFTSGMYKHCLNPEGKQCNIEINISKMYKSYSTAHYSLHGEYYYFMSTHWVPNVPYVQVDAYSRRLKTLGIPKNEQEWNNWKIMYGKYLARTGNREWDESDREWVYYGATTYISSTDIKLTQSFDMKERDSIYVDADVPYRRA